jgi:hypothetical protein
MAFIFDSTVKGPNSNSYVSLDDADTYFGGHTSFESWDVLSDQEKQRYLVRATTRLDYENYGGWPTENTNQALQWPRKWVTERNYLNSQDFLAYADGSFYQDPDTIPKQLKIAVYELALSWIEDKEGDHPISRKDQSRLSRKKIGPLDYNIRYESSTKLPGEVIKALKAIGPDGWKGDRKIKLVR